jgi:hypothetical protein
VIVSSHGNTELLTLPKTAFLSSRKIPASAVLKRYDWAIEQRENGNCIIIGKRKARPGRNSGKKKPVYD